MSTTLDVCYGCAFGMARQQGLLCCSGGPVWRLAQLGPVTAGRPIRPLPDAIFEVTKPRHLSCADVGEESAARRTKKVGLWCLSGTTCGVDESALMTAPATYASLTGKPA